MVRHRVADRGNVLRRRATAAANHIDQPLARKLLDLLGHHLRAFVILAKGVRKTGIRIGADQRVGHARKLRQVRAHGRSAQRAVQTDRNRLGVPHRMPEGRGRLAGKRASGKVGDRAVCRVGPWHATLCEDFLACEDRRLGVERVEDGFDQHDVRAAIEQPAQLFAIGNAQIVEGHGAVAGIVHVRRNGGGAVGRPERAGHETAHAVLLLGADRRTAGKPRTVAVELIDHLFHAVIGLGDGRGGECVRLENVRTRHRIAEVFFLDRLGLRQVEQVVVALLVAGAAGEAVAAEMILVEAEPLNLRAHRAVEDEDTLARCLVQRGEDFRSIRLFANGAKQFIDRRHMRRFSSLIRQWTCIT